MSIVGWIVLGLIAGYIASKIVESRGQGFFINILLGIIGGMVGGWLFERFGARHALWPEAERAVGPDVDFADFANHAGLDVFDRGASVVEGMALIAHLCGDFGFLGAL